MTTPADRPCKNGVFYMRVKNRCHCSQCMEERLEKARASRQAWEARNRDKLSHKHRAYHAVNKERRAAENKIWRQNNLDRGAASAAKRRAAKLQATPPWADLDAIAAFYAVARRLTDETGIAHHVDHIVPLQHPLICGLHVENNLQILTTDDNIAKSNRWTPD